jgi:hypothetical protein
MKTKLRTKNIDKKTKPLFFINPPPLFSTEWARALDFTSLALLLKAISLNNTMFLNSHREAYLPL